MKRKRNLLLIVLIISSLFLILIPKSVVGSVSDIHYTFENDILYSNSSIDYTNSFNLRNKTSYTEIYEASYSFTNDTDYDNPLGFVIDETGGSVNVIPSFDNHDKVLELNNTNGISSITAVQTFITPQSSGTYEFWIQVDDATPYSYFYGVGAAGNGIRTYILTDDLHAHGHGGQFSILDDTWYHTKFDFECGGGGYLGLGPDTYFITVNGIKKGPFNFNTAQVSITDIIYLTSTTVINKDYFDAIGYSWLSNYTIRNNILPTIDSSSTLLEIDKNEFAWIAQNQLYAIGSSFWKGWAEDETGGGSAQVWYDYTDYYNDRSVELEASGTDYVKFKKMDVITTSNFMNVSVGFNITDYDTNLFGLQIGIFDETDSFYFVHTQVRRDAGNIEFRYDGTITSNNVLYSGLNIDDYYEINIGINSEIGRCSYILYENGVEIASIFNAEQDILGSYGIGGIEITLIAPNDDISFQIDYVGVYDNGLSILPYPESYAIIAIPLRKNWNIQNNNLISINGSSHIALDTFSAFSPDTKYRTGVNRSVVSTFKIYENITRLTNCYDRDPTYDYTTLIFSFSGNNVSLYSIEIEGVRLFEGSNEYFLEFEHAATTPLDINYFYVDDNNKLQYTLTTTSSNTEYIQATFDILNLDSTDRAISFRGAIIDKAFGYFYVDYLVGASQFDIPIFEKTTRAILPNNKTIDNFIVLITDNDVDSIIGITTGYVSQPKLLAISSIRLPIITAGLIEMMIPMIMIIVPTLLISKGFGKEGKKLIIPLFFIFSLITAITLIIPIWIFFIIIFGTGLFLARNREMEGN